MFLFPRYAVGGRAVTLQLYNTLTRRKEPFEPIDANRVRMYVCGPTVYDYAHIGNARPVVVFDVLARLLRRLYGPDHVTYARNITDVEDKIIAAALETGETIDSVTQRTTRAFHEDVAALGTLPPDVEPRATDHIGQMIGMIERLVEGGHAYDADGHVLFHVPSMADYGELSGRNRDEQIAGARVEVAPYKRDPADFVLWKPSSDDQPGWDSPWGRGRPGWHIECSAMSAEHLGVEFDIHGGGQDLIFPHHENEIAQSRCAHGTAGMARMWLHNGYVTVGGEKMSKSLGNFLTVHDLLEEFPGEALRLTLLSAHYRQPLDFTKDGVRSARARLDHWYRAKARAEQTDGPPRIDPDEPTVEEALLDDVNTPLALSVLDRQASRILAADEAEVGGMRQPFFDDAALLGLLQSDPDRWFKGVPADADAMSEAEIEEHIAARNAARKIRDFAKADAIRDTLSSAGIVLEDGPRGTTWRRTG